jgi:putative membrane protein
MTAGWSWLIPWDPSFFAAFALAAAALLYARYGRAASAWRKACFWAGLLCAYAALLTRLDYYAAHEFFMGRIQEALLQHTAPFLIALSVPAFAKRRGPPLPGYPLAAALAFNGALVLWLIPGIHFYAMLDWRLNRLMNWSMLLSGLLFWHFSFNEARSPALRCAAMLAVIPAQVAAGALLAFAPHPLYPVYEVCGRAFGGISALQDQQIGGLILWLHGPMMSALGILIVAVRAQRRRPYAPAPPRRA